MKLLQFMSEVSLILFYPLCWFGLLFCDHCLRVLYLFCTKT